MNQDNSSSPLDVLPLTDIRMRSGKYLRDSMASFRGEYLDGGKPVIDVPVCLMNFALYKLCNE
ncbi:MULTISPECIES: hypothetical protein [Pantoea]|jgi:hypothetical protein|uniref:hypothetical protein n=1 Tax=Pantoea TaxID=53335 RepID=UPI00257A539C|nr:hypothetical protein [Pantoea sp.]